MAEFNLAELMKEVSKSDTGKQKIQYIPLALIDPDPANFYSLDGIEELAGSIEMLGLQQPLLVRPVQGGRYMVISGHRRREALRLIAEGGSGQFADGVPCIVDAGEASEALRELKLIMANADTRKMSSADQNKQAERIEDLLRQLVDEGYVFPGRLRDWVSKLSGMSRTKLARMKVIREKLDKSLLQRYYNKGALSESVAYELAQRPAEMQRRICDTYLAQNKELSWMQASFVTEYTKLANSLEKRKCPARSGCRCTNQERILDKAFDGKYNYKPCRYDNKCCNDCSEYLHCKSRCPLFDEKAKEERARQREASKDQRAAEKAKNDAAVYAIEHVWARFGQALRRAGITDAQLRKELKPKESCYNEYETYVEKKKVKRLLDFTCTEIKPNDPMPFSYGFKADDYRRLCTVADALHVSLDYLFLRDDVPDRRNVSETDTEPTWRTGDPPFDGRYLCRIRFIQDPYPAKSGETRCTWRDGKWFTPYGDPIQKYFAVLSWWPIPPEPAVVAGDDNDAGGAGC